MLRFVKIIEDNIKTSKNIQSHADTRGRLAFYLFIYLFLGVSFVMLSARRTRVVHPGKGDTGHTVRVRHRAVRVVRGPGCAVWYHTGYHVRTGAADRAGDAHVPAAVGQPGRCGTVAGTVAGPRVRHRRRAGRIAAAAGGGTESQ